MRQMTLASQASFEKYARKSRREEFLSVMAVVVPWRDLEALIEPYYPKAGNGRQPVGLSIMLRVYFLQQWFSLSDPGAEDALYESPVLRRFAGVDLGRAAAPDETTILRFRRLLEQHVGGVGLRRAYVARPITRRREEGLGRCRLPGPNGGHSCRCSRSAGHDFAACQTQRRRR